MSASPDVITDAARRLRAAVKGSVTTPEQSGYDQARMVIPANFDELRPAVVVRPTDDADVARTVLVAAEAGVGLAVRSGGHSPAGHSTPDGAVVLDVRGLNEVHMNPETATAWAGAGTTAGEYLASTAPHGMATGFGDTASVGLGGITLAGGVGFLSRKYGLTVDELLAAEVVTADGRVLRTDEDNHPDLFWAIRGGGGNFGVATRFHYRLRQVSEFTGGVLILPATGETITRLIAAADAAPEELTTIITAMVAPPAPFIPPQAHGKLVIMAQLAYNGPAEEAERAIAPLQAVASPLADMVGPKPYAAMFPSAPPSMRPAGITRSIFADDVDATFAETVIEDLQASTAMMPAVQFRVLGGAIARIPSDATAFAHRDRRVMVNISALFQNPADEPEHDAWAARLAEALRQRPGAYAGFLGLDGPDRIREAYPGATWDRLIAVKRRYDPANLFRHNHNIPAA